MVSNTDDPGGENPENPIGNLIGFWDFLTGSESDDTGLDDGIDQDGSFIGGATADNGHLVLNGDPDRFDVNAPGAEDVPFQISDGRIVTEFMQEDNSVGFFQSVVSRGEFFDSASEGYFGIEVINDGAVQVTHISNGVSIVESTAAGFSSLNDTIRVTYDWSFDDGGRFFVENLTQSTSLDIATPGGVDMAIGDNDGTAFTFGARENIDETIDNDPNFIKYFDGKIDYVAVYDGAGDPPPPPPPPGGSDGIVTDDDDSTLIDEDYDGDPDGDRVDNGDSIFPPVGSDDDIIDANGGDDTIDSGNGNDSVDGGDGNDTIDTDGPAGDGTPDAGFPGAPGIPAETPDSDPNDDRDTVEGGAGDDTITTGDDADLIDGGEGDDDIDGGIDDDTISGGAGDDVITGGQGNDSVDGGEGNDNIDTSDNTIPPLPDLGFPSYSGLPAVPADPAPANDIDVVSGGAGDDTISTGDDRDTIDGGTGNDVINAGIDNDSVTGGEGDDEIIGSEGADTLTGDGGNDTIYGGLGPSFPDATNIEDSLPGDLADPRPDNGLDLIDGGAGDDQLFGEDDNDTIFGGDGNDTIDGGIDQDQLFGGADRDVFLGGNPGDSVDGGSTGDDFDTLDLRGEGPATVIFTTPDEEDGLVFFSSDPSNPLRFEDIETVLTDPGPDPDGIVEGTFDDDVIDVNYTGDPNGDFVDNDDALLPGEVGDDDIIVGKTGDDEIEALRGDDDVYAGGGDDLVEGNVGDDYIEGNDGNDTLDGGRDDDTLIGGDGDDILTGNPGDDSLSGGEGDDTLIGNDGTDTLVGGDGDDLFSTGPGEDEAFGDADRDTFIVVGQDDQFVDGGEAGDDFDTLRVFGLAEVETESANPENGVVYYLDDGGVRTGVTTRFINIENIEIVDPSALDGVVEGDDSANLIDASYTGDPEGDRIDSFDSLENFVDEPFESRDPSSFFEFPGGTPRGDNRDAVDGGGGDDTILSGDGDDIVKGGDGNDSIFGGDGFDDIAGEDGDDFIDGGSSIDKIFGGDGNDTILGGSGSDILLGGDGTDEIDGGSGNNEIDAGAGDDRLETFEGDDTLVGGAGEDTIIAGDGDNLVFGGTPGVTGIDAVGSTPDVITSGSGSDTLDGSSGADTIESGAGDDQITGGTDSDVIDAGDGDDTVYGDGELAADATLANDGTAASAGTAAEPGNDSITAGAGADSVIAGVGDDTVSGGADNDTVDGGAGVDLILGGTGEDSLLGGDDGDVLFGGVDEDADVAIGGADRDLIFALAGDEAIGGEAGDDFDSLITAGGISIVDYDPSDPTGESGTVSILDSDFNVIGTVDFSEIENVYALNASSVAPTAASAGTPPAVTNAPDADDPSAESVDGVVDGTAGGDLIDTSYTGDPEGDLVDGDDAVSPLEGEEDIIRAGAGDDTVNAGDDDDLVFGAAGDDELFGEDGNDGLSGGEGDDLLDGGAGADVLTGGEGDDTLSGGADDPADEGDLLSGNTGDDTFTNVGVGDEIIGGEDADGLDIDTLDLRNLADDGSTFTIDVDPGDPEAGTVTIFDSTGAETGTLTYSEIEVILPCFTPGTMIATPRGERLVETLEVGDKIITRDNGIQEIRWLGQRSLTSADMTRMQHMRPILIRKGALGNDLPERDMMVSPNHRVLVANDKTAMYLDESEVLVAAKHLTGMDGVEMVDVSTVTYIHFMFDQHEVVLSDGAWTESFQPGDMSLAGLGDEQRQEIFELFPELETAEGVEAYQAARRSLKRHEAVLVTS